MSEATALAFAHEAAMALHDGSMALLEQCGKTTPRRGRPASGDWHLAGWVAAICLRNRITPSESEGTFSAVMTAAWHAVGKANLPTHAVRTMLAKVKAGGSTAFPVAHGVSYWLLPDDAGKPRVIFGHWNEINRQLLPADAQEKWAPKV